MFSSFLTRRLLGTLVLGTVGTAVDRGESLIEKMTMISAEDAHVHGKHGPC